MKYFVYVLFSPTYDKIYIGFSGNVEKRIISHNHLAKKGWTIRFRPWTLIHTEGFETKKEAMAREKELKSTKGRRWIRQNLLGQQRASW